MAKDYYDILQFCNHVIPENERVNLILPRINNIKYEFLKGKGRYYLYPRYFGYDDPNAGFVLSYLIHNARPPENYRSCVQFASDKYLFIKNKHPLIEKICHD